MNKKVVVIWAWFGWLGSAILLARAWYDVTVVEKNDKVWGRANLLEIDGYRRDMWPSWYLMPDAFDRYFTAIGRKVEDYLDLQKLEPSYRVFFKEGQDGKPSMKWYETMNNGANYLDLYADVDKAATTFEGIEPNSGDKLRAYLKSAAYQYGIAMEKFVFKNFDSIWDFMTPQLAIEWMQLNVFTKLYNYVSRFVKNENLKKLLMYPSVFLGTSPYETPALFNIMSHVDFNQWVFYPQGWIHEIPKALYQIALEEGVKFEFNAEVEKIVVEDEKVTGLIIAKSETANQSIGVDSILHLVNIHNFFVGILKSHSISYYLWGSLGLSLIVWTLHRLPNDLDYVVSNDDFLKLEKVFTDEKIDYKYSSKWSIAIEYNWVNIEFESPQSIEKFIFQQTWSTISLTNCFDSREVCVSEFTSKILKPDFYRAIWSVFGGAKYPLDEQMLNDIIIPADIIISNADMRHTEIQLLEVSQQTYPESYWAKQVISPSWFILYLWVDGELPQLKHHTLVFSDDRKGWFDQIFKDPQRPQDPNYYICNPSKTDPSVAPAGKENLFVLVPIAPWLESTPESLEAYRDHIIADIAHNCGIPDLQDRIEVSQIFSIPQFEQYYNAYKGTALGLAHTFFQSAVRRPQNYSKKVKWLYYAGGYTTPGIGMPMCLISAMMVADRVEKNK